MTDLGWMYHIGLGVPADDAQARKWLRKGAELGNDQASYNLGMLYWRNQTDRKTDHAKALYWYRRAAQKGHSSAQYMAGLMRSRGQGAPKDIVAAYIWMALSAEGIDLKYRIHARRHLGRFVKQMTTKQIAEAEKRIRAWTPARYPIQQ